MSIQDDREDFYPGDRVTTFNRLGNGFDGDYVSMVLEAQLDDRGELRWVWVLSHLTPRRGKNYNYLDPIRTAMNMATPDAPYRCGGARVGQVVPNKYELALKLLRSIET